MIEDLIETGQYKEALQYLNDMDNEQVRYQRLVCLYGLKELQQAKREGMKAKVLAGETYYDVVAIYVSILKDLEEFVSDRNVVLARELTKIHEEFIRGNIKEIIEKYF